MPLDLSNTAFLGKAEIKERASSVYTTTGAPDTSEKYSHIPTDRIIHDMEALGWGVVDAKQVRARKGEGFQKHLVVFRNNDLFIEGEDGDDVFPQILLTNSHDGKNSFTFKCAMFRMVCENGLVISTQDFTDVRIRHMNYTFDTLQTQIRLVIEQLPLTIRSMNQMKQTQLGQEQMLDFAQKALSTRFTGTEMNNIQIDLHQLLESTRKEDEGNGLWEIFNRVQEKIINGGFSYTVGAKSRKARKIKNFQQDVKINSELWKVAETFM